MFIIKVSICISWILFCSLCDSVDEWETKQPGWLETMKVLTHMTEHVNKHFPGTCRQQSQFSSEVYSDKLHFLSEN